MSIESIIAQGRRLAATALLDSGLIYDRSVVTDELGGSEEQWTPRPSRIACRVVNPRDPVLEGVDGLLQQPGIRVLIVPVGTSLLENAHVEVNAIMYDVVASMAPHSVTAVVDRYILREI